MTIEKYRNVYSHSRMSREQIMARLNAIYTEPRSPEREMKLQALDSLLRESSKI